MSMVSDVFDFNELILDIQPRKKQALNFEEFTISHACMVEECEEFRVAHHHGDYVGTADAVLDSMYFGIGILYKMGFTEDDINKCFAAIHLANMTKNRGRNAKRDTGAADAIKPEGWIGPEVRMKEILKID